jgi:hypothetical protein
LGRQGAWSRLDGFDAGLSKRFSLRIGDNLQWSTCHHGRRSFEFVFVLVDGMANNK